MPMSAVRAGSPPGAARRTFDRYMVAREGGLIPTAASAPIPMSAARTGSPPGAARRAFDRFIAAREEGR